MKKLYEFKVSVLTEVEKTEVTNENGQEITVKKKVKEETPYLVFMKQPARKENDEFRLFYGKQIKRAIDAGLMTKAVLVNKHIDGAGALISKETARRIADLTINIESIRNNLIEMGEVSENDVDKKQKQVDMLARLVESQREIQAIESSNQIIFQNTAESYAQERANLWLIFNQTYYKTDSAEYQPLFKGANFDEKENHHFDLEEKADPLYVAARDKLALFWSMYSVGRASTPEDFEKIEKDYA